MDVASLPTGCSKSVLLFDEHSLSRHGAAAVLAEANPGWNIVTVSRLSEFLRHTSAGTWDLLALDLPSLGANAEELILVFRQICPSCRIIVLNGPEDDPLSARLAAAGADRYLSKSAELAELSASAASLVAIVLPAAAIGGSRTQASRRMSTGPDLSSLLTERQAAVLCLLAEGRSTKEIARRLGLAVATVKAHLSGTYRALGVHGRMEALAKTGMIDSFGHS